MKRSRARSTRISATNEARMNLIAVSAQGRHLHRLSAEVLPVNRAADAAFDLFRRRGRRLEHGRQVAGEQPPPHRQGAGGDHGAFAVEDPLGRRVTDVEQQAAKLSLIVGQHRFRRRQRLEEHLVDHHRRPVHGLLHGLGVDAVGVEDVGRGIQPSAGHADRVVHAVVAVDSEAARDDVENPIVGWNGHLGAGPQGAPHVVAANRVAPPGDRHRRLEDCPGWPLHRAPRCRPRPASKPSLPPPQRPPGSRCSPRPVWRSLPCAHRHVSPARNRGQPTGRPRGSPRPPTPWIEPTSMPTSGRPSLIRHLRARPCRPSGDRPTRHPRPRQPPSPTSTALHRSTRARRA